MIGRLLPDTPQEVVLLHRCAMPLFIMEMMCVIFAFCGFIAGVISAMASMVASSLGWWGAFNILTTTSSGWIGPNSISQCSICCMMGTCCGAGCLILYSMLLSDVHSICYRGVSQYYYSAQHHYTGRHCSRWNTLFTTLIAINILMSLFRAYTCMLSFKAQPAAEHQYSEWLRTGGRQPQMEMISQMPPPQMPPPQFRPSDSPSYPIPWSGTGPEDPGWAPSVTPSEAKWGGSGNGFGPVQYPGQQQNYGNGPQMQQSQYPGYHGTVQGNAVPW